MRSAAALRCLATSASSSPPRKSGSGGTGKALLAAGLLLPPAAAAYLTRTDEGFRKAFRDTAPSLFAAVVPVLVKPGFGNEEEDSPIAVVDGKSLSARQVKVELDKLEARLKKAKAQDSSFGKAQHHLRFSKEEVDAIKHKVEDKVTELRHDASEVANALVKGHHEEEQEDALSQESEQKQDTTWEGNVVLEKKDETADEGTPKLEVKQRDKPSSGAQAREKLDQLRKQARNMNSIADRETETQIKELEKSLNKDLEVVLARDLGELNEEALRRRVVQLTLELKDRNRWEALRMHEVTKTYTEELIKKYDELLHEQSERYEELVRLEAADAALRASEETQKQAEDHFNRVMFNKEQQWHRSLQESLERQRADLAKDMEQKFAQAKANLEAKSAEELASRLQHLEQLKEKVAGLQDALSQRSVDEEKLVILRELAIAAFDLQEALFKKPKEVIHRIESLEKVSKDDVIAMIGSPASLNPRIRKAGVISERELVNRFNDVYDECYKVALVPEENAGVFEHAMARVVAALTIPGGKSGEEKETTEAKLLHARELLLEKKDLAGALEEMEKLDGLAKLTASDWIAQAKDRVAVETYLEWIRLYLEQERSSTNNN